jgi:hypothetical protein
MRVMLDAINVYMRRQTHKVEETSIDALTRAVGAAIHDAYLVRSQTFSGTHVSCCLPLFPDTTHPFTVTVHIHDTRQEHVSPYKTRAAAQLFFASTVAQAASLEARVVAATSQEVGTV